MIEALSEWLLGEGFNYGRDEPLFEYAERYAFNNQFMVVDNPIALFATSAGVVEYRAVGTIASED